MSTLSHETAPVVRERPSLLHARELWASVAIVAIWLAVLLDALFGPDIVTQTGVAGVGDSATIPSAVALALFAAFATWPIAKHGFRDTTSS